MAIILDYSSASRRICCRLPKNTMPTRPRLLLDTPEAVVTTAEVRLGRHCIPAGAIRSVGTDETREVRLSGPLVCSAGFLAAATSLLPMIGIGLLGAKWMIGVVLLAGIGLAALQDAFARHRTTLYRLWLDTGRGPELALVTTNAGIRDAIVKAIDLIGTPRKAVGPVLQQAAALQAA